MATFPYQCDGKSKSLELVSKDKEFSLQLKNKWLELLELVALFLLKTETCDAKYYCEFFVDAKSLFFCFVDICFEKRGRNTK